jgi:hypothetical protein
VRSGTMSYSELMDNQNNNGVLSENLPDNQTNEDMPISDPVPQPEAAPEAPTSDGNIDYTPDLASNEGEGSGVNNDSQLMDREA